jgi:zinc transport system substrate-binding protein
MRAFLPLVVLLAMMMGGCREEKPLAHTGVASSSSDWTVVTTNFPMYAFATALAPEGVKVSFPVPAEIDPAFWEPEAEDIARMQKAKLLILNGATYEKWRMWASLPEDRVAETAEGFRDRWIRREGAVTHSHGPGGEHAHGEVDFTTWLNLRLAIQQAEAIAEAMSQRLPGQREEIFARLDALKEKLAALDRKWMEVAEPLRGKPLVASHPVYDYFAQRTGLSIRSVHWEPEEPPSEEQWTELDTLLEGHPAKVMLWEGEPLEETARLLAERGITPVVFETAGNRPESGDFFSAMNANAERLKRAFEN